MLATVETAWLFTRGTQSVRIVRAAAPEGVVHLLVQGPGDAADEHEFSDVMACMNFQADLERRLVSAGYELERFTSDRRARDRRLVRGERRRFTQIFL